LTPYLRQRLITLLLPIVALLWLFTAVLSYFETRGEVTSLLDNQLTLSAHALLAISQNKLDQIGSEQEQLDMAQNLLQQELPYENKLIFQVWRDGNQLMLRSQNAPYTALTKSTEGFSEVRVNGQYWHMYALQSADEHLRVLLGEPSDNRDTLTNAIALRNLIPLLMSLPLLVVMLWLGIGRGPEMLQHITEEMQKRGPSNLRRIDEKTIPPAARPLATSMNKLFNHLKTAFDSERRFTADAAHELRTPLAALKTHAEVALQAKNPEEQQQALRQVVRGVNRATRMVEQLLTLARLDPDTGLTNIRRTDLFIIAETIISDEALLAFEKHIEIGLTGTRGKFLNGAADAVAVLIRNLVDNAIRYTPEGGEVEVIVDQDEATGEVILRVADNGPGIPAEDRERVFQRFFRRLGTKSPGTGLGLSIVSRIADLHDARIELGEAHLGGLLVSVYFKSAENFMPMGPQIPPTNSAE